MWKRTPQDWESRAGQRLTSLCTISVQFVPGGNISYGAIFFFELPTKPK
jgi:hypothetical protein